MGRIFKSGNEDYYGDYESFHDGMESAPKSGRSAVKRNKSFGCIFFVVIAVIFLIVIVNSIRSIHEEKAVCSEPVTAVITNYKTTTSGTRSNRKVKTTVLYRFEYNGKKYDVESDQYDNKTLHKGNEVEIFINPDDPYQIYVETDAEWSLITAYVCIPIFIIFIIGGIIYVISLKRKRSDYNSDSDYQ